MNGVERTLLNIIDDLNVKKKKFNYELFVGIFRRCYKNKPIFNFLYHVYRVYSVIKLNLHQFAFAFTTSTKKIK